MAAGKGSCQGWAKAGVIGSGTAPQMRPHSPAAAARGAGSRSGDAATCGSACIIDVTQIHEKSHRASKRAPGGSAPGAVRGAVSQGHQVPGPPALLGPSSKCGARTACGASHRALQQDWGRGGLLLPREL